MKKYGISEKEIENEQTKVVWIILKGKVEKKICSQILFAYFNNVSLWQKHGHRTRYWTKLTAGQEIEFKYILSVYLDSFYKEQDIFISAFIQKNNIFPIDGPVKDIKELSSEEKSKAIRASLMTQGMEFTRIRKALNE